MKKIILILDGMADRRQKSLSGKTPLEYADTPNLDSLYKISEAGCVKTIPDGQEAGSAAANLNLLGFNSLKVYKGRAVIEAAGANLEINENNLYIRCNLITLKGASFEESVIESYSGHDIKTCDAVPLIKTLNKLLDNGYEIINIGSFRNILVAENKTQEYERLRFMPPHDILKQPINQYLKCGKKSDYYFGLMKKAYHILSENNETSANGIWLWGASIVPDIKKDYSLEKKVILAETVLMKGIAKLAGIDCISISEDDGFEVFLKDKLKAALKAISSANDFIYIHIQAPDDLSHELLPKEKAKVLGIIDELFIKGLVDGIKGDYSLLIASDHYTFSDTGGHGREPAPFILAKSVTKCRVNNGGFSESACIFRNNVLTTEKLLEKL